MLWSQHDRIHRSKSVEERDMPQLDIHRGENVVEILVCPAPGADQISLVAKENLCVVVTDCGPTIHSVIVRDTWILLQRREIASPIQANYLLRNYDHFPSPHTRVEKNLNLSAVHVVQRLAFIIAHEPMLDIHFLNHVAPIWHTGTTQRRFRIRSGCHRLGQSAWRRDPVHTVDEVLWQCRSCLEVGCRRCPCMAGFRQS
mmetsp:Transcript_68417/g.182336  ORF Transcript_68417/g.182336 Transcript_68417/m.182336 type:complete len:200 (+) Transcript_68417:3764-4363(+)